MKLQVTTTSTGNLAVIFNGYKFRKSRTAPQGYIVWRCLNKKCTCTVKTDHAYSLESNLTIMHNHSPNATAHANRLTSLSLSESVGGLALDNDIAPEKSFNETADILSAIPNMFNESKLHSTPNLSAPALNSDISYSCDDHNETIESLRKENSKLNEDLTTIKQQWSDVVDHSIDVDKELMENKTLLEQMKISIEVLEAENTALRSENKSLEIELKDLRGFYSPGGTAANRSH